MIGANMRSLKAESCGRALTATIRIEPSRRWVSPGFGALWEYRVLIYFLIWRDIKVRYKQTLLGASWAIIQPLSMMVIFSLFFGRLANIPSDGIPYPIFNYAALVPWSVFAMGLGQSSNSLVTNANVIKKVYFPRLALPLAAVLSSLVDFVPAFLVLLGMMFYYGIPLTMKALWLPLFLLLATITSLGVGLWFAAFNVRFRDVRYILPIFVQLWMFSTPIVYSSTLLPERWRTLYGMNPMVGVVEGFRWALLGTASTPGPMIALSVVVAVVILVSSLIYFRRMEKNFAEIV